MKILIVDDNFVCRKILVKVLSEYGDCDIAVNGKEAFDAFKQAFNANEPYKLVCLDIMMPEMNGLETLEEIRNFEQENNVIGLDGVKVIMTTALDDPDNVKKAFREQCEAYMIKPIEKEKLYEILKELELVK